MGWREEIKDPWNVPAFIAGAALLGVIIAMLTKPEPVCDTACHLKHIKMTLQRIERRVEEQSNRCEGANWRLPYIPSKRDI